MNLSCPTCFYLGKGQRQDLGHHGRAQGRETLSSANPDPHLSPQLIPQGTCRPARVPGAAQVTQTRRHPWRVHILPTRANSSLGRREEEQRPASLPLHGGSSAPHPRANGSTAASAAEEWEVKKDFGVLCQPCPEQADCNPCSGGFMCVSLSQGSYSWDCKVPGSGQVRTRDWSSF